MATRKPVPEAAAAPAVQRRGAPAAAGPKPKEVDVRQFMDAVLNGARTLPQFDAYLRTAGYDDASRSTLVAMLRNKMVAKTSQTAIREGK